jgi:cob(I)alamin adenosyltransferase
MTNIVEFPGNKKDDSVNLIGALDDYIDGLLGYAELLEDEEVDPALKQLATDLVTIHLSASQAVSGLIEEKINAFRSEYDV